MTPTVRQLLKWITGVGLTLALAWAPLAQAQSQKSSAAQKSQKVRKAEAAAPAKTVRKKAVAKSAQKPGSQRVAQQRRANAPVAKAARKGQGSAVNARRVGASAVALTAAAAAKPSAADKLGLKDDGDPLDLSASVALVVDQNTHEVLLRKNEDAVLPIASLTKLMTGLVVVDAGLSMDDMITITQDDVDTLKGSRSRLAVGTTLSRGELMHLALMSSENRAANALGRTFPGGMSTFVALMNAKAGELGMKDTRYVEPTGLSSANRSSARDLAILAAAAYERPLLRDLSTSPSHHVDVGHRTLQFNNSNRLVHNPDWAIGLQKTGYISEAGRCLVMQASVAGRQVIMVFLDAAGKAARVADAERVRQWVEMQTRVFR